MINKNFLYAVVGASNNEEKYGHKVFKDLLDAGYKVVPINPSEQEILGEKVYPTLSEVRKNIDVVINCVGILYHSDENKMWAIHYHTPRALFDACILAGVKKIIQISLHRCLNIRQ